MQGRLCVTGLVHLVLALRRDVDGGRGGGGGMRAVTPVDHDGASSSLACRCCDPSPPPRVVNKDDCIGGRGRGGGRGASRPLLPASSLRSFGMTSLICRLRPHRGRTPLKWRLRQRVGEHDNDNNDDNNAAIAAKGRELSADAAITTNRGQQ